MTIKQIVEERLRADGFDGLCRHTPKLTGQQRPEKGTDMTDNAKLEMSMNLGIEEIVEVWFIPANHEAYSLRMLQTFASADAAREFIKTEANKFFGELEMVRVTIKRQLTA